jgi:hypothetical protein
VAPPVVFRWTRLNEEDAVLVVDRAQSPHMPGSDEAMAARVKGDAEAIVRVLVIAENAGIDVPAALSGPATALHVLASFPEMPKELRGRSGRKRFESALTLLLRQGRVVKTDVKTASRNVKQLLRLVKETPNGPATSLVARESED